MFSICTVISCADKKNPTIYEPDFSFLESEEINDELFLKVCNYYNVKDAKYVLAQAHLESGHFKSKVFKNNNNMLGLYDSKHKCYYKFDKWSDCIKGYVNMVEYKKRENESHLNFLKRIGYAEDPDYITKVQSIYNKL